MAKQRRKLDICTNCERSIGDENFCPNCGQENTEQIVSARYLLQDIADEFFKFDSKLFTTLGPLLFKPGFLTQEYIAGRRVRYIAPWRLYFIVSAFYFLCFSASGFGNALQHTVLNQQIYYTGVINSTSTNKDPLKPVSPDMIRKQQRLKSSMKRAFALQSWMQSNMSLITYFFVPMTALVMQWLYFRSRRLYIEHMVFTAHMNAFTYLTTAPFMFLHSYFIITLIFTVVSLVYTFMGLRAIYQESFLKTLIKCILLTLIPALCFLLLTILAYTAVVLYGRFHD